MSTVFLPILALMGFWWFCNVVIVLPLGIYFYYTVNQVFPVLIAVEDDDASRSSPAYERMELDETSNNNEDLMSTQTNKHPTMMPSVRNITRWMSRFVYSRGANIFVFRGFGWLFLWNMIKLFTVFVAVKIPIVLGILVRILVPLAFTQLHILWVHTILVPSTPKPFWKRFVTFKEAKNTVALPMLVLLIAEASATQIMKLTYGKLDLRWQDSFPLTRPDKTGLFAIVLVSLALFIISPLHLLLVRVETSLLSPEEETVIPLDPALTGSQAQNEHLTFAEAVKTLKKTLVLKMFLFYCKTGIITVALTLLVGLADFFLYMLFALQS